MENEISKCDGCGDEIDESPENPYMVADEMLEYIGKQNHWDKFHSPSVCWGMLLAVFRVVFHIAPNEEKAVELITDCMAEFLGSDSADA